MVTGVTAAAVCDEGVVVAAAAGATVVVAGAAPYRVCQHAVTMKGNLSSQRTFCAKTDAQSTLPQSTPLRS